MFEPGENWEYDENTVIKIEDEEEYKPPSSEKRNKRLNKPKVVSDWSDNEVFQLIACVHAHPTLWDASNSQYRHKNQRKKLWYQLSKNVFHSKFAGAELIAKWSNLRIQFRSYANKKPKSDNATAPPINWKFFAAMQFIGLETMECKQTADTESNFVSIASILLFFLF